MFSDGFSEGQTRDINDGFPAHSHPYADEYDYMSDSDLEDGCSSSGEDEELHENCGSQNENREDTLPTNVPTSPPPPPSPVEANEEAQNDKKSFHFPFDIRPLANTIYSPDNKYSRMGKVAIIRDMGAVTYVQYGFTHSESRFSFTNHSYEAFLYFLYTGEMNFAPLSSDPRYPPPAQSRAGDWSMGRLPSPSAKSVYRLADKVAGPGFILTLVTHLF